MAWVDFWMRLAVQKCSFRFPKKWLADHRVWYISVLNSKKNYGPFLYVFPLFDLLIYYFGLHLYGYRILSTSQLVDKKIEPMRMNIPTRKQLMVMKRRTMMAALGTLKKSHPLKMEELGTILMVKATTVPKLRPEAMGVK